MAENTNTEREAFKSWHRKHGDNTQGIAWVDALLWKCWQARASLSLPAAGQEPVAHLWQHGETGRTRIVLPDMIIDADASWQVAGPLYLAAAPQPAVAAGWMPIETAPKDGSEFIALIGGLPYTSRFDEYGRFTRYAHTNRRGMGRSYTTHLIDGKELIEVLNEGEDDKYEVSAILWSRGFSFTPTHWMPLPPAPKE